MEAFIINRSDPWKILFVLRDPFFRTHIPQWREFMLNCCQALQFELPTEAMEWLAVAEAYQGADAEAQALQDARLQAWKYLGKDACRFDSPEVCAVGALIFLLDPGTVDNDTYNAVLAFVELCDEAGMDDREQLRLLRRQFPDCLGQD